MKEAISQKKAAIAFLARDCEKTLPGFLEKTEQLRACFMDSRIYAVENGSKDATRTLLKQYEKNSAGVTLHLFDDPMFDSLHRMQRMVLLRNKCLELVKESQFQPDYYIIIDSDLDFDVPSVGKSIQEAPDDWAGLFANGRYYLAVKGQRIPVLYYDLYAFLPDIQPNEPAVTDSLTEEDMIRQRPLIQESIKRNNYVKCRSAFGGIGIYQYSAVADCRYTLEKNTVSQKFDYLCEHIPFNREVLKKGSLYVCSGMKTYYEPLSFKTFLKAWAKDHDKQKEMRTLSKWYKTLSFSRKSGRETK